MSQNKLEEKNQKKVLNLLEYHRVSTYKQKRDITIEQQRQEIKKFLNFNEGLYNVVEIYEDEGKSGFKYDEKERPEYNKMLKRIREDPSIDGVLAYDMDRFGRVALEGMGFIKEMYTLKKEFVLVNDKIDPSTPFGEFYAGIKQLVSQLDGKNIKNKTRIGRERKKQLNIQAGRDPYYGFGRKKKVVPKEIKDKMIDLYTHEEKKLGFKEIQKIIQKTPYLEYDEEKKEYVEKTGFKLATSTIGERLKEWGVEIRVPKYYKPKEYFKKEVDLQVSKMKEELLKQRFPETKKVK